MYKALLAIDGAVNLLLGTVLLASPAGVIELVGLPPTRTDFYVSILAAVIFGIGIALVLEFYGRPRSFRGLSVGVERQIVRHAGGGSRMTERLALIRARSPIAAPGERTARSSSADR